MIERNVAGLAGRLAVGGDSPAFGPPDPVSEIFAVAPRRIAARQGEIAVAEAVAAVGGDAAADRRPGEPALSEGGAVAEGGDDGVAADGVAARPRHHRVGIEHRREAVGGARRPGRGGGEGAVGGEQLLQLRLAGQSGRRSGEGEGRQHGEQEADHDRTGKSGAGASPGRFDQQWGRLDQGRARFDQAPPACELPRPGPSSGP